MDLNKVMLIGRVATDLEVKKMGDSGISVVNFSLATNRSYKNKSGEKVEEAEFHRCVAFGNLADIIGQYVNKGMKIYVEGRLRTRQWEDQTGNKRYTTEILVNNLDFCESKGKVTNIEENISSNNEEDEIPF